MALLLPAPPDNLQHDKHAVNCFNSYTALLQKASEKDIPSATQEKINNLIVEQDGKRNDLKKWYKQLRKTQQKTVFLLAKEVKLTPLNYYRNQWMAVGMGAFGVPIGVAIGLSLGNIGLLGLGLPMGMSIGLAVGAAMDKQAKKEGRQLDVDLKVR